MVAALGNPSNGPGNTWTPLLQALLVTVISAPVFYLATVRPLAGSLSRLGSLDLAEEQVRKLSAAVEQSPTLVLIATADGTIEYVNASFAQVTGYGASEVVGQHVHVLRRPETPPEEFAQLWQTITAHDEWHGEICRSVRSGERRWEQVTVSAIKSADGRPVHYLVLMEDITERKHEEEATVRRLAMEESIAEAARLLLTGESTDLTSVLSLVGRAATTSHVCIFRFSGDGTRMEAAHEWHAPGLTPVFAGMRGLSTTGMPWCMAMLRGGQAIVFSDPSQIPTEAAAEAETLGRWQIRSVVAAPLFARGKLTGFVAFIERERRVEWPAEHVRLLQTTADILESHAERARAEHALRHSEERTGAFIAAMPDIVAEIDAAGCFVWLNDEGLEFFGADAVGKRVSEFAVGSEERRRLRTQLRSLLDGTADSLKTEVLQHRIDGEDRLLSWMLRPLTDEGEATGVVATARDITARKRAESERRELEQQLFQLQKMEAVSRLAGGVAHDFNNMLAAILGYAELSLMRMAHEDAAWRWLEQIRETALRASNLTRQLLAFSRRQIFELKPISLNDVLMGLHPMLRRLIPENIELVTIPGEGLGAVMADAGQVEQVVVNLAVNARDAMPDGGTLLIETASVELDEEYARTHASVRPGAYVRLSVTDTGCGMSKQVQQHLFEPFFTTKEHGRGTGLGLATVYGIVKQLGGDIWVYSEVGQGTTMKVYLPHVDAPAEPLVAAHEQGSMPGGTETVLVVDDEPVVRSVTGQSLRQLGYSVLEAANSAEALHVLSSYPGPVHLLFTDVVMPGMGGRQLAETAVRLRPDLRTLFMSGHTDNATVHEGVLDDGIVFLQKPFTVAALAGKVRQVLDASP